MQWKTLVSLVLLLVSYIVIVQCRYDASHALRDDIFKQPYFDSNNPQLRDLASASKSLKARKLVDPWMKALASVRAFEDESDSNKFENSRRSWSQRQQFRNFLQQSRRDEADGISYTRPIESPTCGRQETAPQFVGRIVGGHEAVPHSWPWQVLYQEAVSCGPQGGDCISNCGGSLINENFVLTAAHCVNPDNAQAITIIAGVHNKNDADEQANKWQQRSVSQTFVNPGWNPNTLENDIAILRLSEPVIFNSDVQPVCLPGPDPEPNSEVVLIGWGLEHTGGETSPVLKQTQVRVIDDCQQYWTDVNVDKQLCFRDPTLTSSSCQGDSGGPALQKHDDQWVIEGVTSFGHRICEAVDHKMPVVYTRVSAYLSWINGIIQS